MNAKKIFVFAAAMAIFASAFSQSVSGSFALVQETGGSLKTLDLPARGVKMKDGSSFRFYVKPNESCFVYLYYANESSVLFKEACAARKEYFFPGAAYEPFKMEASGAADQFSLIISKEKIAEFENAGSSKKALEEKVAALVQKNSSAMKEPIKSALSGATQRAAANLKVTEAFSYSGGAVYIKAVTIKEE